MQKIIYKKILLLSGGADSMLLLQRELKKEKPFDEIIFFDYGQKHYSDEKEVCKSYLTDEIKIIDIRCKDGFYESRNKIFIENLRQKYIDDNICIYIGTNADDKHKDNNKRYFYRLQWLLNESHFSRIKIVTPLIKLTKKQILEELNTNYFTD